MRLFLRNLLCFFFMVQVIILAEDPRKHVIGCRPAGFFSNFNGVINHLIWCKKNRRIPVVFWGRSSFYHVPGGYNGSRNVWEYYFYQVSHLSHSRRDYVHKTYYSPDRKMIVPSVRCLVPENVRREIKSVIDQYIRIKPNIQKKIHDFYKRYMEGKNTIGIHLRGTDKKHEIRQVDPRRIVAIANQYARDHSESNFQFLVATDDQRLLEVAKRGLQGKVIYYQSQRSHDGSPIHRKFDKARLGEEVLIEALLLSKCDVFIHTISNVSCAVTFFNPLLRTICL